MNKFQAVPVVEFEVLANIRLNFMDSKLKLNITEGYLNSTFN